MKVLENISLKPYNTFGVDAKAKRLAEVFTGEELVALIRSLDKEKARFFILGGGSNLLFTKDYDGTVVRVSTRGIWVIHEEGEEILVKAEAGEVWDEFVEFCVNKGWGGLENLSLIPGNVGTGPVQNIGAYGAEIKDVLHEVHAFDRETSTERAFTADECHLGYRDSLFKRNKGRYIILSVTFRLSKNPLLRLDYKDVKEELQRMGVSAPDILTVREAVCSIRRRKLPDPAQIGNSGSFFKNPVIGLSVFENLKSKFPGIVGFPQKDNVKLAAAWLIEQCGWKGYRKGDAGVHPSQPLVLVNYGNATGLEVLELAQSIKMDVREKFGIELEEEVNIL
jgi:UDP-N-acetylmuramate dehydrogenase